MDSLWKFSIDTILAILSLAVSIVGLFPTFRLQDVRKKIVIVVVLVIIITSSALTFIRTVQYGKQIELVSNEIVEKIGPTSKTFDQLFEELYYPDFSILSEALDNLINEGKVGHRILEVHNDIGESFRVRGFYLKTE